MKSFSAAKNIKQQNEQTQDKMGGTLVINPFRQGVNIEKI